MSTIFGYITVRGTPKVSVFTGAFFLFLRNSKDFRAYRYGTILYITGENSDYPV